MTELPLPTLTHALAKAAATSHGVNFIAGEAKELRVPYSHLRERALGILGHLQGIGAAPETETIVLVDGLEPFVVGVGRADLGKEALGTFQVVIIAFQSGAFQSISHSLAFNNAQGSIWPGFAGLLERLKP